MIIYYSFTICWIKYYINQGSMAYLGKAIFCVVEYGNCITWSFRFSRRWLWRLLSYRL